MPYRHVAPAALLFAALNSPLWAAEPAHDAATATVESKDAQASGPHKVCRTETATGSVMPRRVCRTVDPNDPAQARMERELDRVRERQIAGQQIMGQR